MDTTVRNLDEQAYRALRARAALEGRTVGELLSDAIRVYLARLENRPPAVSLRTLVPEPFPEADRLSAEIDTIVYGTNR